jgi:hypothetical protein
VQIIEWKILSWENDSTSKGRGSRWIIDFIARQVALVSSHKVSGKEAEVSAPDAPAGILARVRRFFGGG